MVCLAVPEQFHDPVCKIKQKMLILCIFRTE